MVALYGAYNNTTSIRNIEEYVNNTVHANALTECTLGYLLFMPY
jgi:hypothetical protein